ESRVEQVHSPVFAMLNRPGRRAPPACAPQTRSAWTARAPVAHPALAPFAQTDPPASRSGTVRVYHEGGVAQPPDHSAAPTQARGGVPVSTHTTVLAQPQTTGRDGRSFRRRSA